MTCDKRRAAGTQGGPTGCRFPSAPMLIAIVVLAFGATAAAASLRVVGDAVAIGDGDSFDLQTRSRGRMAIRLHAIDAPEKPQAHAAAARSALARIVAGRPVRADCYKRDRHGRHVCRVWVGGEDVQLRMLRRGHAWHLATRGGEQTGEERRRYAAAQIQARAARRGLWAQAAPMPPWTCRQRLQLRRRCR